MQRLFLKQGIATRLTGLACAIGKQPQDIHAGESVSLLGATPGWRGAAGRTLAAAWTGFPPVQCYVANHMSDRDASNCPVHWVLTDLQV